MNLFFLMNSELITNTVTLLSNNTSTTIHSVTSSYFNPIFTITSLNNFSFFSILFPLLSTSVFHTSTDFSLFAFSSLKTIFLSFLISLLLPSPMFITLSFNTSNLFKDLYVSFSSCLFFIFLQLQVICPKPPQTKHFLSIITLSLFTSLLLSHASCHLHSFSILFFLLFSFSLLFSIHCLPSFFLLPLLFSFFFSALPLPTFPCFLFFSVIFLAVYFSNLLLLATSIFVFVDLTTSCYSPLSVSTI